MENRWKILGLLFSVRLSMAFQFQTAASLAPFLMSRYGVQISDIGLLISLYLAPGLAFAIPGGAIGRRFGDKRTVLFGLALMILGGITMAFAPTWGWQLGGRIVAGVGGVILNVLMSKMVTDWFAGKEIATAMGIFVNSWPAGIALCLIVMPVVLNIGSMAVAYMLSVVLCALGFVALALMYVGPQQSAVSSSPFSWPDLAIVKPVVLAGCIWGLFNAALGMVFGFGTALLLEKGWTPAAAGSATSLVLWGATLSVPFGGFLADRWRRPVTVMLTGFVLFALGLLIATRTDHVVVAFIGLGIVAGLSAGPIMSLPTQVLPAQVRSVGMGIYLTLFYVFVVLAPVLAGSMARSFGTAQIAFDFGALLLGLCFPAYLAYRYFAKRAVFVSPTRALA